MPENIKINIATGLSAKSRSWVNTKTTWVDLVEKLSKKHTTNETHKEFMSASKTEQGKIKDVGGYVGGYLRGGRRKPANVLHRQLVTLDLDFATRDFWDDLTMIFDNACVVHSTHKHSPDNPRLRMVLPLSREVSADEYVAIARKIAGDIGIDLFDDTTFETSRLMFWQSCSIDAEYLFKVQDGDWVDADEVLSSYVDWTDTSAWSMSTRKTNAIKDHTKKQADPAEKKGLIGAFCRTFGLAEAIEKFLPDEYTPTRDGRYTYAKGSTAGGLVTYEDKFAFSHHGTDPSGGTLCNAFDLVRIHNYGDLDTEQQTGSKAPSFKAMTSFVQDLREVKRTIADERMQEAKYLFMEDEPAKTDIVKPVVEVDNEWMEELEIDGKKRYLSTSNNVNLILRNDTKLKGRFGYNEFDNKRYVLSAVPWRKISAPEPMKDVDYSGLRNYIDSIYGISGNLKVEDSLALDINTNKFHPIKDYLNSLEWDGVSRVDTLLTEYMGAIDNLYTREATRKTLVGAVARIFRPGVKFDLVLTLVGEQGVGKSALISNLGGAWFSDTFDTVKGKSSFEQLQGAWIIEIAELSGLRKSDIESVKHFLTKRSDSFRPAYGRVTETFKRQCIFFATTNDTAFLSDSTGNRRFNPVRVCLDRATKDVFKQTADDISQIWAEAVRMYRNGETIYMGKEAAEMAKGVQLQHTEHDERAGVIEEFVNMRLPIDWSELDLFDRNAYMRDNQNRSADGELRKYVCTPEIWCECLGKPRSEMTRYNTKDINAIMRNMPGWSQSKSTKRFGEYGQQKFYERIS